jgi:hypothetical protein
VNFGLLNAKDHEFLEAYPGLPQIRPINPIQPSDGWTAVTPTMEKVNQYGLMHRYPKLRPWFESLSPVEKVGTISLYYVEPGAIRRVK